jgi:hypothetical protein
MSCCMFHLPRPVYMLSLISASYVLLVKWDTWRKLERTSKGRETFVDSGRTWTISVMRSSLKRTSLKGVVEISVIRDSPGRFGKTLIKRYLGAQARVIQRPRSALIASEIGSDRHGSLLGWYPMRNESSVIYTRRIAERG